LAHFFYYHVSLLSNQSMFLQSHQPPKNINNASPNVHIQNDQVLCPLHQKPIINLFRKTGTLFARTVQLLCPFCYTVGLTQGSIRPVTPKAFPGRDGFLLSFNDVPKLSEDPALKSKPSLNFPQRQLEYFILDKQSVGYSPRNLVYIPELDILVAASNNGRVTFYSMGDNIEYLTFTEIQRTIRCVKYIPVSPDRKYLMLGTEKEVYVYNIKDKKPEYVTKLDNEVEVNDIEYIEEEQKMLTVGNDKNIRVWNLNSLELDRKISADQFGIDGPLCTIIHIQEKNKLAIEHERGFFVITLKKSLEIDDKEAPDHYLVQDRYGTGLGYIPQSQRFLLRISKSEYAIVNGKTFEPIMTVSGLGYGEKTPGIKFISSPEGTQIVCNANSPYFATQQGSNNAVSQSVENYINKTAGIQVIPDQYRLIFGDEASGRIIIYRLNRTDSSSLQNLVLTSLLSNAPAKPFGTGFSTNTAAVSKSSFSFGTATATVNQTSSFTSFKPVIIPPKANPLPSPRRVGGSGGSAQITPQKSEPKSLRKRDDSRKIQRKPTEIVIKKKTGTSKNKRQKSKDDERERSASSKKKETKSPKKERKGSKSPRKEKGEPPKSPKKPQKETKSPRKERSESKGSKRSKSSKRERNEPPKSPKKEKGSHGLVEVLREHKSKSKKDEKVWIVFQEDSNDNQSTRSKKPPTPKRGRKQDRKASVSEERSRSRTKSKSKTRK